MPGATDFRLECDNNGHVIAIHPNPGNPITGTCVSLSTVSTPNGVEVTQVVMETEDFGTCTWKKVGGVWMCV